MELLRESPEHEEMERRACPEELRRLTLSVNRSWRRMRLVLTTRAGSVASNVVTAAISIVPTLRTKIVLTPTNLLLLRIRHTRACIIQMGR
jgi:hypothetical protein